MNKEDIKRSCFSAFFSAITIGALTILTYKTELGIFLISSFGSSMLLLYGYPESTFSQPKNIFFWPLIDFNNRCNLSIFYSLANLYFNSSGLGVGIGLMILLKVTHPPAGANPIIVIMGSVSLDFLINPIITGSLIILIFGVILNRLILKKKYPL